MKLEELKNLLKPLIRETLKELILEENGVLSHVIKESLNASSTLLVSPQPTLSSSLVETAVRKENKNLPSDVKKKLEDTKKRLLETVCKDAYNGVDIFAGTEPLRENQSIQTGFGTVPSPLSHIDPGDAGVPIENIPGANLWSKIASSKKK